MTRLEFESWAEQAGIDPRTYSLSSSADDDAYVVERSSGGWAVFFSERGHRNDEEWFATEPQALADLKQRLERDPTVRIVGWLRSFDVAQPYAARRVRKLRNAQVGDRTDYIWARIDPPIQPGEVTTDEPIDLALIAGRHQGYPLSIPVQQETHVYVCVPRARSNRLAPKLAGDEVINHHWGIIHPTRAGAEESIWHRPID